MINEANTKDVEGIEAGSLAEQYSAMRTIRRFEETMREQFDQGNVPGPLHLSIGQEAVAVGGCWGLRESDAILSTHRGHHHCIAKGARLDRMMAELLGRRDGYSRGRGGSMHVAIPELGIVGTNGIVGGGLPIAPGVAFAMQVQRSDDVVVCFFGEGAAATGAFGEALNIAGLWSLPVVFLCENNQYVEMTPNTLHVSGEVYKRASGYGFDGTAVDGNDVAAVAGAVAAAVEHARSGAGPTLIEAETYRWTGHFVADKARYRPEGELERWQELDPVLNARAKLDGALAEEIDARVEHAIAEALAFALASPRADADCIFLDHYAAA